MCVGKKTALLQAEALARVSGLANVLFCGVSIPFLFFSLQNYHCRFSLWLVGNGYVYETFGIPKHILVKLQVLLIRAEMPDNPLTAKCFIYDVMHWLFSFNKIEI